MLPLRTESVVNGVRRVFIKKLRRGMIYWATVAPKEAQGSEQNHPVPSPWVIVSANKIHSSLPIVQAVPLTSKVHKAADGYLAHRILIDAPSVVAFPESKATPLTGDSIALTEQVRCMSHSRLLGDPIGELSPLALSMVDAGVRYVLDL
jgi:mRNA-degrading endonuclease toxin of MazEF toxin-antitoxin module